MLKIKNLSKTFHGKKIIDDISLDVDKGNIAFFLGPSGVGKSTLLRLLNNLEPIDSGTILLDGKKLNLTTVNKTHTIGLVFQQFNLFVNLTIEQNITLPLEKILNKSKQEAEQIAHSLLAHYGIESLKNKYPSQLSGGQKQRVALARMVALKPKIICLDEPTSALDPLLTSNVAKTIQDLANEGYIILVASHDVELLKKLHSTIYLMNKGKIVESAQSDYFKKNKENFPFINKFIIGDTQ
jgi:ABC-type polar amino acid transport system ATPase subunit